MQPEGVEPLYSNFLKFEKMEMETELKLGFLNEDMLESSIFDELETQQN